MPRSDSDPTVSVILPVHNAEREVGQAIESILNQTFQDFELIVVDDGSFDASREIVSRFPNPKIRQVSNEGRQGLSRTLNLGLSLARGRYIARMDADDVSAPERLEVTVAAMEREPEIGLAGSWVRLMGSGKLRESPKTHEEIKLALFFDNVIQHPSVIFRRDLFAEHELRYDPAFEFAQDYDLWVRAIRCGVRAANVPLPLLFYRVHAAQASQRSRAAQREHADRVRLAQLRFLGIVPSPQEEDLHVRIARRDFPVGGVYLEAAAVWLERLAVANQRLEYFQPALFERSLAERWFEICFWNTELGTVAHRAHRHLPLGKRYRTDPGKRLKFALNALFRRRPAGRRRQLERRREGSGLDAPFDTARI